ncbi:L,D-transpeptidase [Actinomadura alba]|uniref:L,D-transpeptidase n=1 Tax=Actinomadura alba TaxID=406431 RepID=UPI0028ABB180|nr:L,D-transpeptidase [Actinomadura alba]
MSNIFKRTPPGGETPAPPSAGASRRAVAATAAVASVVLLAAGCGGDDEGKRSPQGGAAAPAAPAATAKLPQATTYTDIKGIPQDPAPFADSDGTVVHPTAAVSVSASPGGPPVATLPVTQLGGPTWVPVVETKAGWLRVLLPSRPNRATGWIPSGGGLQTARSSHVVKVDLSARRLTLLDAGRTAGTWSVAVGAAKTPTPTGRTFMLASLAPAKKTPSPLILPVGAHSATLDTFGGGPGTVAFHGWPTSSVFGRAVTHGCVRVPPDALKRLSRVPLGTPVLITD